MPRFDIIKIEENGRIDVSDDFAYDVGLLEGSYFLLEINSELKEINLERIAIPGKDLLEVEMVAEDKPGVLSKINNIIGGHGANIMFNEAEEIQGTSRAAIVSILEVSDMNTSIEELKKELKAVEDVDEIYLRHLDEG
ncbi:MAG: ACT domain-containing protein [Candidatus Natronoplasma sp.]